MRSDICRLRMVNKFLQTASDIITYHPLATCHLSRTRTRASSCTLPALPQNSCNHVNPLKLSKCIVRHYSLSCH